MYRNALSGGRFINIIARLCCRKTVVKLNYAFKESLNFKSYRPTYYSCRGKSLVFSSLFYNLTYLVFTVFFGDQAE